MIQSMNESINDQEHPFQLCWPFLESSDFPTVLDDPFVCTSLTKGDLWVVHTYEYTHTHI